MGIWDLGRVRNSEESYRNYEKGRLHAIFPKVRCYIGGQQKARTSSFLGSEKSINLTSGENPRRQQDTRVQVAVWQDLGQLHRAFPSWLCIGEGIQPKSEMTRGDITTELTNIKKIFKLIKRYCVKLYTNKFDNLDELDKFLKQLN